MASYRWSFSGSTNWQSSKSNNGRDDSAGSECSIASSSWANVSHQRLGHCSGFAGSHSAISSWGWPW